MDFLNNTVKDIESTNFRSVVMLPPDDGDITDEEFNGEDEENSEHAIPTQLRAESEIIFNSFLKLNEKLEPLPKVKMSRNWKCTEKFEKDLSHVLNTSDDFNPDNHTVLDTWEAVFNNEIITLIVEMSNKYAMQHNHQLSMIEEEIKVYIAILLLTGYLSPKNIRMFWEVNNDTHNNLVSSAMTRNRFLEIHKYLHMCDNSQLPSNDKYAKLSTYYSLLNDSFIKNFKKVNTGKCSIGETMVSYYGEHETEQHIHGKLNDVGYKLWSICTPSGFLAQFIPYQGPKSVLHSQQESDGLGAAVVLQLVSNLPKSQSYDLFFDNFFTSFSLLEKLTELGHFGTGAIKENCVDKRVLKNSVDMKKEGRGSMSMATTEELAVVAWNDDKIVNFASNAHGIHPISNVTKIVNNANKKTKITVPCPKVVSMYYAYMGGVHSFNQSVNSQRISFRGKKWWFPLFAFGLDAACQNSWKLYQSQENQKITYCEFRRNIVQIYLAKYKHSKKRASTGKSQVLPSIRTDNSLDHVKEACNQARCAHCHQRTRIKCKMCQVPLHINCWYTFHNK